MADNGFFQINDLVFDIPPESIAVKRETINNHWQTLRTRSSIKLASGFSNIKIMVNLSIEETGPELEKLRSLIAQVRVTPFCYVENQKIRNSVLGGTEGQSMVLALKQLELVDEAGGQGGDTNILTVRMFFSWFNYFPFTKDWRYKRDIFVADPVRDPRASKAWKILYEAEQNRGNYISALAIDDRVFLDLTQYMLVDKKKYLQTKKDLETLRTMQNELRHYISTAETSEFLGIPPEIYDPLLANVYSDETNRLIEEIAGNQTSMLQNLSQPEIAESIRNLIVQKEKWVESYGQIVDQEEVWKHAEVDTKDGRSLIELSDTPDLTVDKLDKNKGKGNKLLMYRNHTLDLQELDIVVTGISISFENVLACIPVIGHPYPTFQHIGSIDAAVTLSMMTTKEAGIQALSAFYTMVEDQSRKMKQVPAAHRNIRIRNSLVNLCGLHEFLVENLHTSTVPQQPGTYYASMVLVNNPITSDTQEKIVPGQSFTTSQDIREEVIRVLNGFLRLREDLLGIDNVQKFGETPRQGLSIGNTQSTTGGSLLNTNNLKTATTVATGTGPLGIAAAGAYLGGIALGKLSLQAAEYYGGPVYEYNGPRGERYTFLQTAVEQYNNILSRTFREVAPLTANLQADGIGSGDVYFGGAMESVMLFDITDEEVLGVRRLQKDVKSVIDRYNKSLPQFDLEKQKARVQRLPNSHVYQAQFQVQAIIRNAWEEHGLKEGQPPAKHRQEIYDAIRQVEEAAGFSQLSNNRYGYSYFRREFIERYLDDFNKKVHELADNIVRSGLLELDEFKSVNEIIKNRGTDSSGNCYPDFPLEEIVSLLGQKKEYQQVITAMEEAYKLEGLGLYNISMASLIGPEFYLHNSQTDTLSEIIEPDFLAEAIESIKESQGPQKEKAEKDWVTNLYEKDILGDTAAQKIKSNVANGSLGFHKTRKEGESKSRRDQIREGKNEKKKRVYQEIERKEQRIYDSAFLYNDLEDFSLGPAIYENTPDGGAKGEVRVKAITNEEDTSVTTANRRSSSSLRSINDHYALCQHRFDLDSALGWLPPSKYQQAPITDPNKNPEWHWPTSEQANTHISSPFGVVRSRLSSTRHKGIDVVRRNGNTQSLDVRAAAEGQVIRVTKEYITHNETWGEYKHLPVTYNSKLRNKVHDTTVSITIKHSNGWTTIYKHLQWEDTIRGISDLVHGRVPGQTSSQPVDVSGGQVIGKVGNTGYSTGAHLHFETRINNTPVDPLKVINDEYHKDQGPVVGIDPNNESLLTKSVEQFEKEIQNGQGYSMLRAYPTFRLYFIESDLGERKRFAFDDFFSYSSVAEIQMIRNRKIAADLVILRLTNVSGVLSNRKFRGQGNEDKARTITGEIVKEDPLKVSAASTVQENPIASLMLQPGIQVQLRLGYSSNPNDLEKPFNGVITDVSFSDDEDIVEVTCQSYGIELVQNIYGEVKEFGGWFRSSGKTSEILEELMAQPEVAHFGRWEPGSTPSNPFRGLLSTRWKWVASPYDDNIFAPTGDKGIFGIFDSSPKYLMYRTTIWDVFQEMTLRHPAYIASAVPYDGEFGPRMTMFFGVPDQLYFARDPTKKEQQSANQIRRLVQEGADALAEIMDASKSNKSMSQRAKDYFQKNEDEDPRDASMRNLWVNRALLRFAKDQGFIKTFRSYHVLTSSMHILKNSITSTSWNTFNVATVQYEDDTPDFDEKTQQLNFDDAETATVLCDAGIPDEEKRELFAQFNNCIGEEMAKRYGLALVADSLREGYRGSITIIGNPHIKPHDICYIFDEYNDMVGPIEVEQVVHKFSQQNGFITEITPNMCIHINQASTLATEDVMGLVAEQALKRIGMHSLASILRNGSERPGVTEGVVQVEGLRDPAALARARITSSAVMGSASKAFSPLAIALWAAKPVGTFILRKLVTRTQLTHGIRYSPLVLQGKPMIGGLPTRYVDGSFIQGIKTWFKETDRSRPLYLNDTFDKMIGWVRPEGNISSLILGGR